ncbi:LytR/AlgR family response regulator transcription factor [Agathobaculum sp.]|uniref:LytR/AlgR family response regulator transcription factor n=1 Tax=Agathobaculum sp. TaxID=2048138 RepID=UPI001C3A7189|nr:LytTR family DNA-binding domain-containing protein [Agathobaculum sp.]HIX10442.1 LytTR family DNA-binding domain-containing protein [Candidatus Agathobaculum pullistercoris]
MKISVAVCDDLEEERLQMARMLKNYGRRNGVSWNIELLESGDAFLEVFQPGRWDIVLMDIYMDGLNGMEAARRLRVRDSECTLIFVTTSMEHGIASYELQASDYLVKPVAQRDMDAALDWCLHEKQEHFRTISVRSEWDEIEILLRDILYIEIRRHTAFIHTAERIIQTPRGMNALEEEIASDSFLRCHRSFLVNQRHILRMEKRDFVMDNGDLVPIGSSDAAATRQKFMDWLFLRNWKDGGAVGIF